MWNNEFHTVMDQNRMKFSINQETHIPLVYALSDFPGADSRTEQAQKNIRAFAEQGISLVSCDTNLSLGWFKSIEGEYDALKAELAYVLKANPQARILLRLHMNPPYWWMRDHPEELIVYRTPEGDKPGLDSGESDRAIRWDTLHRMMKVSIASRLWLKEAGERLRGFLQAIQGTPEGSALMAIQVAYGHCGEWHQMGTDCGPAMQRFFHSYLRRKYSTDEALRGAWRDDTVCLESAPFHPEHWQEGSEDFFRDPKKQQNIIDAQMAIQQSNIDAILYFAKLIKEETSGKLLVGTFYGYYLYTFDDDATAGGHLFPEQLYAEGSPIDFLCGPFPYEQNRSIDGVPMQRGLLESSRLNHMLWLTEMDQAPVNTLEYPCGGDPAQMNTSIGMLRRNILMPILSGQGAWFYDHRVDFSDWGVYWKSGWWDHPKLMEEIGKLRNLFQAHAEKPYRPAAEVLVVFDTKQYFIRSKYTENQYALCQSISEYGAVADMIYLNDLPRAELNRYKVIIFPNAYLLTAEQKESISRLTRGKEVVWMDAPGYCDGNGLSLAFTEQVTGMKLAKHQNACGYKLVSSEEFIRDKEAHKDFRIVISDEEAEPLATLDDGAVCAARKGRQWFFASPVMKAKGLRQVFKEAGVHSYCDGRRAAVLADGGMVAVYSYGEENLALSFRGGKKRSHLFHAHQLAVFDDESGQTLLE